jgi:DNA-binding CsgD family transcriptional regulator
MTRSSPDLETVSRVIALAYDAALDPDLWPAALEGLGRFTGAAAAFLYFQDLAGSAGDACWAWGDDPAGREARFRAYARANPANTFGPALAVGEALAGSQLARGAGQDSAIHRDWMRPQGFVDFAMVVLARTNLAVSCLMIATRPEQGRVQDWMLERLEVTAPHYQRAAAIAEVLGLRKVEVSAFSEVLDRLNLPVFLVDRDVQVLHANARGRAMLEDASVLNCRRDVLSVTDPAVERAFRRAISAVASGLEAVGEKGAAPLELQDRSGGRLLVHLLPLSAGLRERASLLSASAAVFVVEADAGLAASVETLAADRGLTGGETRVLRGLLSGAGTREVAEALHVSENTVNTHLRRVFDKTGVHSKAELLKMLAGYAAPLERA